MEQLFEGALSPAASVTEEAVPIGTPAGGESSFIMSLVGSEAKYLYFGAGRAAEMQTGREDTAVVEDEKAAGGEIIGEVAKACINKIALMFDKESGSIAANGWITGNQLVRKGIVVIGDADIGDCHRVVGW
jgi:hypothetical protein